jgi:hypothetical protein
MKEVHMFWFFVPLVIVVAIIVAAVAIVTVSVMRRGGDGTPTPGRTLYDREEQNNSPKAPPA